MNEPSQASSSPAVDANVPAQWMNNNSFAASANNMPNNMYGGMNNSIQQPQYNARKPKRNRNNFNSDNQKIVSGRSFKRLRLDHTNTNAANMMSSTQSTGSVSHLSMGGAGKSALVLFYHFVCSI